MAIQAGVFIEGLNKAVRVNGDGHPEHMFPVLTRIVAEGRLDDFASLPEYSWLVRSMEEFEDWVSLHGDAPSQVPGVGFSYGDVSPGLRAQRDITGNVYFYDAQTNAPIFLSYHYLITKKGGIEYLPALF